MRREDVIARIETPGEVFDVLVIGGGATGFACALDALSRGYSVALVERGDFGEGTSSRSTKLIHGGVRYLRQGHLGLVRESLRERRWFFQAAPHLVQPLEFIIPCSSKLWKMYYRAGMGIYDAMARTDSTHRTASLSAREVLDRVPGCATDHLAGGVRYMDGQFDDARMIISFLHNVIAKGGAALNYAPAKALIKENGRITGAIIEDRETGRAFRLHARVVINATGVYTDRLCNMDEPDTSARITSSQGIHLVLDSSLLGGASALMIPKTDDGRVLFAIPWHGRVLLGTTDTLRESIEDEPAPLESEIDYLLHHAARIFSRPPDKSDIRGMFAGLRPLPRSGKTGNTSAIVRDYKIDVSASGLVSIYGGKWTTCRAMGEAALEKAIHVGGLPSRPSQTANMTLEASREPASHLAAPDETWVHYAVQHEMARTIDDLLLRRTRLGILDAEAARGCAPQCARWMAEAGTRTQHSTLNTQHSTFKKG